MTDRPRVLWLTTRLPSACANGSDIAGQNLIDALRAAGAEVGVVGYATAAPTGPGETPVHPARGDWSSTPPGRKLAVLLRSWLSGKPMAGLKYLSAAYLRAVRRALVGVDLCVVDHYQLAWAVDASARPTLYVAQNIESAVFAARAERAPLAARLLLRHEIVCLARCEDDVARKGTEVWTLTDEDAAAFRPRARRVRVMPLPGLPFSDPAASEPRWDITILGLWAWEPNLVGLRWFLDCVVPCLPSGLSIAIGGLGCPARLATRPGVHLVGEVADAQAFLAAGRVHAIPSVTGGGIQLKTINAIAMGIPLVATRLALRGIADAPGHVRVADGADAFAAALLAALADPRSDASAGRNWQDRRRTQLTEEMRKMLAEVGAPSSAT